MKDTFYFSHDYNVRSDDKIKRLIRKHGMEGYGVYWAIIEDLYNNTNVLRLDYDGISYDLRVYDTVVESIINDFDLFEISGDTFGSISIQKRLEIRNEKSKKARESVAKRWAKDTNVSKPAYERNTIKEKKVKERIDSSKLLEVFNSILGKRSTVVPAKAKKQLTDRLNEGYTKENIVQAIKNASKDQHHIDTNYKFLTIEFITRPDKLERFVNQADFNIQRKLV
mgnify:FL=1